MRSDSPKSLEDPPESATARPSVSAMSGVHNLHSSGVPSGSTASALSSTGSPPSTCGSPGDLGHHPGPQSSGNDLLLKMDPASFLNTMSYISKIQSFSTNAVPIHDPINLGASDTSPGPGSSRSSPQPPSLVNESLTEQPTGRASRGGSYRSSAYGDLSLMSVSSGIDRKQREFTPESKKDEKYWERRRKNNEAAKRSREKRRQNDALMEREIAELKDQNEALEKENAALRLRLGLADDTPVLAPPLTSLSHKKPQKPKFRHISEISEVFSEPAEESRPSWKNDVESEDVDESDDDVRCHAKHPETPSTDCPMTGNIDGSNTSLMSLQHLLSLLASNTGLLGGAMTSPDARWETDTIPPAISTLLEPSAAVTTAALLFQQAKKPDPSVITKNPLKRNKAVQKTSSWSEAKPPVAETPLDLRLPLRTLPNAFSGDGTAADCGFTTDRTNSSDPKLSELAIHTMEANSEVTWSSPCQVKSECTLSDQLQTVVNERQVDASIALSMATSTTAASKTHSSTSLLNSQLAMLPSMFSSLGPNQTPLVVTRAADQLTSKIPDGNAHLMNDSAANDGGVGSHMNSNDNGLVFPMNLPAGDIIPVLGRLPIAHASWRFDDNSAADRITIDASKTNTGRQNTRRAATSGPRSPSKMMDERYRERRRRNNEAVRRCRENKRARINMRDEVTGQLQNENKTLRNELDGLNSEVRALRQLLSKNASVLVAAAAAAATKVHSGSSSSPVSSTTPSATNGTEAKEEHQAAEEAAVHTTTPTSIPNDSVTWSHSPSIESSQYALPKKGLPRLNCRRRLTLPPPIITGSEVNFANVLPTLAPNSQVQ